MPNTSGYYFEAGTIEREIESYMRLSRENGLIDLTDRSIAQILKDNWPGVITLMLKETVAKEDKSDANVLRACGLIAQRYRTKPSDNR